jgi:hypothetical protein
MNKIAILILSFSTSVFALTPHKAHYSLSMSGVKIANELRVLTHESGFFNYTAKAKTSGWARLIKDYEIKAQSNFILDELGIHSNQYQLLERDGKKIKKNINVNPKYREVDSLSLFLALSHALSQDSQQTDFYFQVNNGKKTKSQHYQRVKSNRTGLIKIINPSQNIVAYFSKEKEYLPVSIKKGKFNYQLKEVEFSNQ